LLKYSRRCPIAENKESFMSTTDATTFDPATLTGDYVFDAAHSWNMALEAGGVVVSENVTLEFDISATKTA
jgi:hypothetical protein